LSAGDESLFNRGALPLFKDVAAVKAVFMRCLGDWREEEKDTNRGLHSQLVFIGLDLWSERIGEVVHWSRLTQRTIKGKPLASHNA
jgi:hypothetical protein